MVLQLNHPKVDDGVDDLGVIALLLLRVRGKEVGMAFRASLSTPFDVAGASS